MTLEALRWLADAGASFTQIDADGKLIVSSAPRGATDPALTRQHARAADNDAWLPITQALLDRKLQGQSAILRGRTGTETARGAVEQARVAIAESSSVPDLRYCEAAAAAAYWGMLAATPVLFARADLAKLPRHWSLVGVRHSALSGAPRNAVSPGQAISNYLYTVLESEMRIALLATGLDPELGLMHADRRFRNSLALDLIEPLRPVVDQSVLRLLDGHVFSAGDFIETRSGAVRLVPPIPQLLAGTAPLWATQCAQIARWCAQMLAQTPVLSTKMAPPGAPRTPHGRAKLPNIPAPSPAPDLLLIFAQRCQECARTVSDRRNRLCGTCEGARRLAWATDHIGVGQAALGRLRAAGKDPSHGGPAGGKRSAKAAARHAEAAGWRRNRAQVAADREEFRAVILPLLQSRSLAELSSLTGLSKPQCSMVKRGLRTLHPRHWSSVRATLAEERPRRWQ